MSTVPDPDEKDLQKAESLFQYGTDAANKGNYPYAIDMYRNACRIAPLVVRFRNALRAVQRLKFGNEPNKVGKLVGAKIQPIRLRVRTARSRSKWMEAFEICEDGFELNPWDLGLSRELAEVAQGLDSKELAKWAMESVQNQAGDDLSYWKHMARVYEFVEDFKRAIRCWERIKKLAPHDQDATHQIHALSASDTIAIGGLHDAIKRAEVPPTDQHGSGSGAEAQAEMLRKQQAMSPEERAEFEIKQDPASPRPYLDLAEHYRMQGRLDDAKEALGRGLKALPDDPMLRRVYAEIQISRMQKAIEALKQKLAESPEDPELKAKLGRLTAKLAESELSEAQRRVEQNPEDLGLRLDLGRLLANADRHDEAIAEFQAARASIRHKIPALIDAGKSFEATGVLKLAERSFAEALKAADADNYDEINEIRYRLGRIAEQLGNFESAEEHYNEVAANNFGYLDVAQRLRSLNQRLSP